MASTKKKVKIAKDINKINKQCLQIQEQTNQLLAELNNFEVLINDAEKNIWHGGRKSAVRYRAMRDNASNSRKFLKVLNQYVSTQTYNAKKAQQIWNNSGYSKQVC